MRLFLLGLLVGLLNWSALGAQGPVYFPVAEVKDELGQVVSTEEWSNEGFPIVVVLWAEWSSPSRKLLKDLKAVFEAVYAKTYWQIYTVSVDDERTLDGVRLLWKEMGLDFKLFFDHQEALVRALSPDALPAVFVLNQDKEIIWNRSGYLPGMDKEIATHAKTAALEVDATLGYLFKSETFSHNVRQWWVGRDDVGKRYAEFRDGSYFMGSDSLGLWSKAGFPELHGKIQYKLDVRIRRHRGRMDQSYGIALGDFASGNYFDFGTSENFVFIRQYTDGVLSFPKSGSEPCDSPDSEAPLRCGAVPNQVNTFTIERYGDYYIFFMNGWKMAEVNWSYPLAMDIGFVVWQGCHIEVEDVTWGYPPE